MQQVHTPNYGPRLWYPLERAPANDRGIKRPSCAGGLPFLAGSSAVVFNATGPGVIEQLLLSVSHPHLPERGMWGAGWAYFVFFSRVQWKADVWLWLWLCVVAFADNCTVVSGGQVGAQVKNGN